MALIKCPECGKEVSDKAASCPNCGYPLTDTISPSADSEEKESAAVHPERFTDVGEFHGSNAMLYLGVFIMFLSIPFFLLGGLGIITAVIAGFMIAVGIGSNSKRADCTCPYCGVAGTFYDGNSNYRCHACKKISVYVKEKNLLEAVK